MNRALEALHFAFRAVTARPDAMLGELGMGRIHHRILYFVGRNPGGSVADLLRILGVSKQYLNRPFRHLMALGYVTSQPDPADRRVKRIDLTPAGAELEGRLTGDQRQRLSRVFADAGPDAEAGWRRVMALLADSGTGPRGV
ncbi:MAG: MarR family winged helix-turn-helix transcriptional regulator [Nitrospirota bacterium]|nr:MarR family winged helix-turn-helix transcriptional regulator [Nitrospirota bacterium]